ncbi:MAG: DUF1439 domain-containing protein [Polaromonas sp.]
MTHRQITHSFLYLLLASTLAACGFSDGKFTLDFSAKQIQDAIAPKFPAENCRLPLACIKLQNPIVTLQDNSDRITLTLDTTVSILQQPVTGTAVVSAKPRYQPSTGEIFLDDSQIQDLKFPGVSPNVTNFVTQYGSVLAKQSLERTPIYNFKNTQTEKMARMSIADVKVVGGKLRVSIDPTMQQLPKTTP